MSREPINSWVEKAKNNAGPNEAQNSGVNVVRREAPNKGAIIMEIADRIWPSLMEMFRGMRDDSGMLLQPAHVRGIALNVAQDLMKKHEAKNAN